MAETPDDDGLSSRKLLAIKIARWSKLREKLEKEKLDDDEKVDRKKYAITVYARAVFFISKYLDSVRKGTPMAAARALRLVQDLVDICFDAKVHFLGMTTMHQESDYLVYHQVNTCLLSIVFGGRARADQGAAPGPGLHRPLPRRGDGHHPGRAGRRSAAG